MAPVKEDSRALISLGLEYRDILAFTIPLSVVRFVLMLYSRSDYRKARKAYRLFMDSMDEEKSDE